MTGQKSAPSLKFVRVEFRGDGGSTIYPETNRKIRTLEFFFKREKSDNKIKSIGSIPEYVPAGLEPRHGGR
jgi:hypothetical protein